MIANPRRSCFKKSCNFFSSLPYQAVENHSLGRKLLASHNLVHQKRSYCWDALRGQKNLCLPHFSQIPAAARRSKLAKPGGNLRQLPIATPPSPRSPANFGRISLGSELRGAGSSGRSSLGEKKQKKEKKRRKCLFVSLRRT